MGTVGALVAFLAWLILAVPPDASAQSAPAISAQPQDQSVLQGANAAFSVLASGQPPLAYAWYHDGAPLLDDGYHTQGAASSHLIISNALTADAGSYWVTVSNRHGMVTSRVAILTILLPPSIATNPPSQIGVLNSNVTFAVTATGTEPLGYRWQKDGVNLANSGRISGATSSVLVIATVQTNDAGSYRAVVTNAYGAATSAVATLTVVLPPVILQQPRAQDGVAGLTASFEVTAIGTPPLAYQWQKDGVDIPAATSTTLLLSGLQTSDARLYSVWVSNAYGATPSSNALLTVSLPVCAEAPEGIVSWWRGANNVDSVDGNWMDLGAPSGFSSGPGMVGDAYKFQGGYDKMSIGDGDNLKFTNSFSIEGWINITAYPAANAGAPGAAILIRSDDRACYDPYYLAVTPSGRLQFHIEGAEQTPPCGQSLDSVPLAMEKWYHVGAVFDADAGSLMIFTNGTLAVQAATSLRPFRDLDAQLHPGVGIGNYANWSGSAPFNGLIDELAVYSRALSESDMRSIYRASYAGKCAVRPEITQQPSGGEVLVGQPVSFQVIAVGKLPLIYQWQKDGTNLTNDARLTGADSALLSISNLQTNDSGSYRVVVTNSFGTVTSLPAVLSVITDPRITTQPTDQRVLLSHTATFAAIGAGTEPLYYQWHLGGVPLSDDGRISGATTPTLVIQNVQSNDVGGYTLIVSNTLGTASSAVANLTLATVRYVNAANPTPAPPYTTWATAATAIQDAVDAGIPHDWVVVTNGVYQTGGRVVAGVKWNRVVMTNQVTVVALNGPRVTTILGDVPPNHHYYGTRCVWLGSGSTLSGFTLSGGGNYLGHYQSSFYDDIGGGIRCESSSALVSGCIISGNTGCAYGGGVYNGTLVNCVLSGNSAWEASSGGQGGGAYVSTLLNCTIVHNSALIGGGTAHCNATNCIIYYNTNGFGAIHNNYLSGYGTFASCCTEPLPPGSGNITNEPAFINLGGGDYHLETNSPCIDAGDNAFVSGSGDVEGAPRVVGGTVDLGAYERQHAPWIVVPPFSQSAIVFSNALFTAAAVGDEPLTCRWQKNGVDLADDGRITGVSTPAVAISGIGLQDAADYRVVVTNLLGAATSSVATLTVIGPPIISVQPASRTLLAGTNVSFSVSASGLAALSYQWRFNQGELVGMTGSSISLTNVQSANTGDYDVIITNVYGGITSSVATLTVLPAVPTITTQAVSRVASVGQTVSFTVAAKGSEPLSCQWQRNGTNLAGATAFSLTLTNVNAGLSGSYCAAVSNAVGGVFSTNVTLVVSPVLLWGVNNRDQVQGVLVAIPASATNVIAIAAGHCTFPYPCLALRADGALVGWGGVGAAPSNAVDIVAISSGGPGPLKADNNLALRSDGNVVHWYGTTTPSLPPALTCSNIVAVAAGGTHQLALRDDGTVIAWGGNSYGQTNVPPAARNVIAIAAGGDHSLALRADGLVVGWGRNDNGQTTSLSNAVNVVAIAAGGSQSLALLADGSAAGIIITNDQARTPYYSLPPADATNLLVVSAGSMHSLAIRADRTLVGWGLTNYAQLQVPPCATNVLALAAGGALSLGLVSDPAAPPIPPRIARPPLSRAVMAGQDAVFNALTVGGLPLRYQWYRNGTAVAGQTNAWLALADVLPGDAGDYQLVALNQFGSATSAVATVTVAISQPRLESLSVASNGFRFSFQSIAGVLYIAEYRDQVTTGAWTELERRFGAGGVEVVTDANAGGEGRFYRVRALYAPPPLLSTAAWVDNTMSFGFPTADGAIYVVEYKTNLADSVWLELSRQAGTGAPILVNDPNPSGASRFYRVRLIFLH